MGVGFGLVISREHHHPILCRPLPGAKGDTLTVPETVELLKGMGYRHLTLVMDRGMVSEENLRRVTDAGFDQVGLVKDWPGAELGLCRSVVGGAPAEAEARAPEAGRGGGVWTSVHRAAVWSSVAIGAGRGPGAKGGGASGAGHGAR